MSIVQCILALFILAPGGRVPDRWVNATDSLPHKLYTGTIAYCYQPMTGGYQHQIWSIESDGSGNYKMIESTIGLNHHSWSPDGLKLAAVGYFPGTNETWSIHTFNADGTDLTRLTHTTGVWDSEPAWSPDGAKIIWTRIYPSQNMRNDVWLMDENGENQHYLGVEGFAPKYAPDGSLLVYCSNYSGNYEIYTCEPNGYNIVQLTFTPEDEWFPSWSPNGQMIIYCVSDNTGATSYEIRKMNADGTNQIQLTSNNWMDFYPRYSPDGSTIAFVSDASETDKWEVYVMDTTGNAIQRVTYSPDNVTAINPDWKPLLNPGIPDPGSKNLSGMGMSIYPNPTADQIIVICTILTPCHATLQLIDVTGRVWDHFTDFKLQTGKHEFIFLLEDLPSGSYVVRLKNGSGDQCLKTIIKN
ncbi:MAG: PD40 domain-containing protein [Bacteroidia bacterium]|nr:PD40 domain-containing protein [Bacteroidia bacterium]